MSLFSQTVLAAASSMLVITLAGCEDQSAQNVGEKAGKAIDQAVEKAGNVIDDAALTAKVKTAIARELGSEVLRINVDTANGSVVLSGTVDTQQNSDRATEIAKAVEGVKTVVNRLTVKSTMENPPTTTHNQRYQLA